MSFNLEDNMDSKVLVDKVHNGQIHIIKINRPYVRNAVDRTTAEALVEAFTIFDEDNTSRVAILCGNGGNFCSGADLKSVSEGIESMNRIEHFNSTEYPNNKAPMGPTRMILSKPVIAAVSGYAVAGGLELASWCDLRILEEDAKIGVFCRRWGVPLIDGGTVRLPKIIGAGRSMDLILTGREVDAFEAHEMGFANRVVSKGSSLKVALELAKQLSSFPQITMKHDRLSAIEQEGMTEGEAMANEFRHGLFSIKQAVEGASQFASGSGRHGIFDFSISNPTNEQNSKTGYKAVIFDMGGVVFDSPMESIFRYENEIGIPKNTINRIIHNSGENGSFAKLERGELMVEDFYKPFDEECKIAGFPSISGEKFVECLLTSMTIREPMIKAIDILRQEGLKTVALTNNFRGTNNRMQTIFRSTIPPQMDATVESCVVGLRKPDPKIFLLTCERLSIKPTEAIFLDDIGKNLKTARKLGMTTIKVNMEDKKGMKAIKDLGKLLNINLIGRVMYYLRGRL